MSLPRIYTDDTAARKHLESLLWPDGPFCPHCRNANPKRIHKLKGKSTRPGVYKCRECEKPFSVTVGTVFERSHIPLHKWIAVGVARLIANHLTSPSSKAHQKSGPFAPPALPSLNALTTLSDSRHGHRLSRC
jgi:Transposase zinc-ribbon domain